MGLTAVFLLCQVARPAPAERLSGKKEEKKEKKNKERTALDCPYPASAPCSSTRYEA